MAKEITMGKLLNENDKHLIQAQAAAQCLLDNGAAIKHDVNTVAGLTWALYDRLEDLSRLSEEMQDLQNRDTIKKREAAQPR